MFSWFVGSSPGLGSVLTVQSLLGILSLSLSLPLPCSWSLSLSKQKQKQKKQSKTEVSYFSRNKWVYLGITENYDLGQVSPRKTTGKSEEEREEQREERSFLEEKGALGGAVPS